MANQRLLGLTLLALLVAACAADGRRELAGPQDLSAALASIDGADILARIKVLASDDFEGRAPGTRGETLTVDYLIAQFKALGLKPGNPDGTYVQRVPFTGFTSVPAATARIAGKTLELKPPFDLQVRDGREARRGGGAHSARDGAGGLSVRGRDQLLRARDVRASQRRAQSRLPCGAGVDPLGQGEGALRRERARLRRPEEGSTPQEFPAGAAGRRDHLHLAHQVGRR